MTSRKKVLLVNEIDTNACCQAKAKPLITVYRESLGDGAKGSDTETCIRYVTSGQCIAR